jgi:hypothetical protein
MKENKNKKTLYWPVGNTEKGFKIVTRHPRKDSRDGVIEPKESYEDAQRWIALQWLLKD